jgi:hypothetical protein
LISTAEKIALLWSFGASGFSVFRVGDRLTDFVVDPIACALSRGAPVNRCDGGDHITNIASLHPRRQTLASL